MAAAIKSTYSLIQNYFLNSAYSFALFGVYALTIAPFVNEFFEFGKPNTFIAVFGFTMLIAEFIALKFKLKIIRVRTQLKRIEYKKQTGLDILPSITPGVLFGFFARLLFHVGIVMVCMTALGYDCNEKLMSPQGVAAVLITFVLEMAGLIYLFMNFDIYTDTPRSRKVLNAELKADDEWNARNLNRELAGYSYAKETAANIVLQIFSCMIFSAFWQLMNSRGIETVIDLHRHGLGAFWSFVMLFPLMLMTVVIGLRPLQIANWIEASLLAFSEKEKRKNWIIFTTVGIFVCAPTIIKYVEIYLLRTGDMSSTAFPEYVHYILALILFLVILQIEIRMLEKAPAPAADASSDNEALAAGSEK